MLYLKRIFRWLFNGLTMLSVLLLMATLYLWANCDMSHHWLDTSTIDRAPLVYDGTIEFGFLGKPNPFVMGLNHGFALDIRSSSGPADDRDARRTILQLGQARIVTGQLVPPNGWRETPFGDGLVLKRPVTGLSYFVYFIPIRYAVAVLGILPSFWFIQYVRVRRRRLKISTALVCLTCGYDLRASPDRCPECGTPVVVQSAA